MSLIQGCIVYLYLDHWSPICSPEFSHWHSNMLNFPYLNIHIHIATFLQKLLSIALTFSPPFTVKFLRSWLSILSSHFLFQSGFCFYNFDGTSYTGVTNKLFFYVIKSIKCFLFLILILKVFLLYFSSWCSFFECTS